jgi:glutamate racemase
MTTPPFIPPTVGVFDSGFGGLTVLGALIARAPQAQFAFIGDTARLPYGSKSQRTIARYAAQSARFLVEEQGADYLVIACNTASALALDAIKEAVPSSVTVIGVIEPGARSARRASKTGDVLVIATDATVQSHAYAETCGREGLRALEKACPLLVPLVEEGWIDHPVTAEVLRVYLDELNAEAAARGLNPDTLVLGCTHYPLLKPLIERSVPAGMRVIDSAEAVADSMADNLFSRSLDSVDSSDEALVQMMIDDLDPSPSVAKDTVMHFFATDSVEKFERLGSRFLGRPVQNVQLVDLGG